MLALPSLALAFVCSFLSVEHLSFAFGDDDASFATCALAMLLACRGSTRSLTRRSAVVHGALLVLIPCLALERSSWFASIRHMPWSPLWVSCLAVLASIPCARILNGLQRTWPVTMRGLLASALLAVGLVPFGTIMVGGTLSFLIAAAYLIVITVAASPAMAQSQDPGRGTRTGWERLSTAFFPLTVGFFILGWTNHAAELLPPLPFAWCLVLVTGTALVLLGAWITRHLVAPETQRHVGHWSAIGLATCALLGWSRVTTWRTVDGWEGTFALWVTQTRESATLSMSWLYPVLLAAFSLGPFLLWLGGTLEVSTRDAHNPNAFHAVRCLLAGTAVVGYVHAWNLAPWAQSSGLVITALFLVRPLPRRSTRMPWLAGLISVALFVPVLRETPPAYHPITLDARDVVERTSHRDLEVRPGGGAVVSPSKSPRRDVRVIDRYLEFTPEEHETHLDELMLGMALVHANFPRKVLFLGPLTNERVEVLTGAGVGSCDVADLVPGTTRLTLPHLMEGWVNVRWVEVPEGSSERYDLVYVAPHPLADPRVAGRFHRARFAALSRLVADGGALVVACDPRRGAREHLDSLAGGLPDACLYTYFDFWMEPAGEHAPIDRAMAWVGPWCLFVERDASTDVRARSTTVEILASLGWDETALFDPRGVNALRIDAGRTGDSWSLGPRPRHTHAFTAPRRLDPSQGADAIRWLLERAHAHAATSPALIAFLEGLEDHARSALPSSSPQAFRFGPHELEAYRRALDLASPTDVPWLLHAFVRLAPILRARRPNEAWRDLEHVARLGGQNRFYLATELVKAHLEVLAIERAAEWLRRLSGTNPPPSELWRGFDPRRIVHELRRELIEALLRRMDHTSSTEDRALLDDLTAAPSQMDAWLAIRIRVALASGEPERARAELQSWLRTSPSLSADAAPQVLELALNHDLFEAVAPWAASVFDITSLSEFTKSQLAMRCVAEVRQRVADNALDPERRRRFIDLARRALDVLAGGSLDDPAHAEAFVDHCLALGERGRAVAFVQRELRTLGATVTPGEPPARTARRDVLMRCMARLER